MIKFSSHSGIYTLESEQTLPISLAEAWRFFSSPANLAKITPDHMGFSITSPESKKAYPGQIITYNVGVLPLIRMNWVTEITQVEEGQYFIDEQRFGPYSMWHHEHHFIETEHGVLMYDKVSYKLPLGPLGHLAHSIFVKRQLKQIFEYRFKILEDMFPIKSMNGVSSVGVPVL